MSDLRRRIIRLAAESEPALKKDLLSILKDQADPVSHDQNLPATYYGLPPKAAAAVTPIAEANAASAVKVASLTLDGLITELDRLFPRYNTKKVTDWNKVYESVSPVFGREKAGSFAHHYSQYRSGILTKDQALAEMQQDGLRDPSHLHLVGRQWTQKLRLALHRLEGGAGFPYVVEVKSPRHVEISFDTSGYDITEEEDAGVLSIVEDQSGKFTISGKDGETGRLFKVSPPVSGKTDDQVVALIRKFMRAKGF